SKSATCATSSPWPKARISRARPSACASRSPIFPSRSPTWSACSARRAGAAFRKGAELVLRKLDQARESVRDVANAVTGHVELGVIPALHVAWVPAVLARVSRAYPGITVAVRERASSDLETELEA